MQKGLLIQPGYVYSRNVLVLEFLARDLLFGDLRALLNILVHVQVFRVLLLLLFIAVFCEEFDEAASLRLGRLVRMRSLFQKRSGIIGVSVFVAAQLGFGGLYQKAIGRIRLAILVRQVFHLPAYEIAPLSMSQL